MATIFIRFSIFLYSLMAIVYIANFKSFLIFQISIIALFIVLYFFKNKYTWYSLLILILLNLISYFIQCDNFILRDSYFFSFYCGYRPFDLFNYFSMFIPLNIPSNYFDILYFSYLLVAFITINLKKVKSLYFKNYTT